LSAPLYRETTDYVWALTRQIDRVAEAANGIDAAGVKRGARLGLLRYATALRQLYVMVKPVLMRVEIPDHMGEIREIMRGLLSGSIGLLEAWRRLDRIQMELIRALQEEDLLIRKLPPLPQT
jgi:hypothetical protein